MNCDRCASDKVREFNGELGIHFPSPEGLTHPLVWVFPKMTTCLECGFVEFVLADEQLEELKNGNSPAPQSSAAD